MIYKDVKAYKLAIRSAWAISPLLAVSLRDKFPLSSSLDGRSKGISCLSSLAIESPEGLRNSWDAVGVLLDGLLEEELRGKRTKMSVKMRTKIKSNMAPNWNVSHSFDMELGTQDLLLWTSAPVPIVLKLLSRIARYGSNQDSSSSPFDLHSGVTRYCARSLSVVDPKVLEFYLPQLVQLLRGEMKVEQCSTRRTRKVVKGQRDRNRDGENGCQSYSKDGDGDGDGGEGEGHALGVISSLLLELAESSALLCHR